MAEHREGSLCPVRWGWENCLTLSRPYSHTHDGVTCTEHCIAATEKTGFCTEHSFGHPISFEELGTSRTWVGNYWAVLFKCPKGHRQGDRNMVVWEKPQVPCKVEVSGLCEEAQTLELDRIHKKVTETHREEENWL